MTNKKITISEKKKKTARKSRALKEEHVTIEYYSNDRCVAHYTEIETTHNSIYDCDCDDETELE